MQSAKVKVRWIGKGDPVAQREAAEAMQPGQGAFDNPAEDAEAAAMRTARLGRHRHDALRG